MACQASTFKVYIYQRVYSYSLATFIYISKQRDVLASVGMLSAEENSGFSQEFALALVMLLYPFYRILIYLSR